MVRSSSHRNTNLPALHFAFLEVDLHAATCNGFTPVGSAYRLQRPHGFANEACNLSVTSGSMKSMEVDVSNVFSE